MSYEFIPAAAPNFMRGRGGNAIGVVVLHTTVGSMAATIATFQNPGRIASAHYVVGLDGRVVQMVFEWNTAYHAGNFTVNERSVGIEHVDDGNYNGPRTPALYDASIQLVAEICRRNGIPIDRTHIRKHKEVSDNPTACPDALDVERIVNGAANLKYSGGSGSLEGDDLSAQDSTFIADLHAAVSRLEEALGTATPAGPNPAPPNYLGWSRDVTAALSKPTLAINLAPILDAINDLKAHGDPIVREAIAKVEAHLNAPRPPA